VLVFGAVVALAVAGPVGLGQSGIPQSPWTAIDQADASPSPAAGPASPAPPAAGNGPGDVYLALGDSIAAGIGAVEPAKLGYVPLLHGYLERLSGQPVALVNLAIPGETSASLCAGGQLARALRTIREVQAVGWRLSPITLTIGANDLLGAGPDPAAREQALAGVAGNLQLILADLRATLDPHAPVDLVVTTYYDLSGTDPTLPGSDAWWVARLNETITAQADAAGAQTTDVQAAFVGRREEFTWAPTDIHPTDAGHRRIANLIWRALGYDRVAPTVAILRPSTGVLSRPVPTVAARVEEGVAVAAVELWVDGALVGPLALITETGEYAALWDTRRLPPGPRTLEIRATDAAGNIGVARLAVELPGDMPTAEGPSTPS
jgi:lysophospholipase L1-like esterase